MLSVSNVNVYDLKESVIASGNAMRTEPVEYTYEEFEKGLERCKKLTKTAIKSGNSAHSNYLVGIRVSFDVTYPQYWSPEFQRYHFADIVTSSSKMHRLLKMNIDKACNKYVSSKSIEQLEEDIERYNRIAEWEDFKGSTFVLRNGTSLVTTDKNEALYYAYIKCISDCPMGIELFMRISTNYKQLQNIYFQRKNHKLREWGNFCKFIEDLPYFKELILGISSDEDFVSNIKTDE